MFLSGGRGGAGGSSWCLLAERWIWSEGGGGRAVVAAARERMAPAIRLGVDIFMMVFLLEV